MPAVPVGDKKGRGVLLAIDVRKGLKARGSTLMKGKFYLVSPNDLGI